MFFSSFPHLDELSSFSEKLVFWVDFNPRGGGLTFGPTIALAHVFCTAFFN